MSVRLICDAPYVRPDGTIVRCTYLDGHNRSGSATDHSWVTAMRQDAIDAAPKIDYTPQAVQAFLDSMTRGEMDPYLEAILAVGHNRKRTIRGTPGFTKGGNT